MSRCWTNESDSVTFVAFTCPACGHDHHVSVRGPHARWSWNGSVEKPTLAPSLRVSWKTSDGLKQCHSQVTNGQIYFYPDSTHERAGLTVDLPEQEP